MQKFLSKLSHEFYWPINYLALNFPLWCLVIFPCFTLGSLVIVSFMSHSNHADPLFDNFIYILVFIITQFFTVAGGLKKSRMASNNNPLRSLIYKIIFKILTSMGALLSLMMAFFGGTGVQSVFASTGNNGLLSLSIVFIILLGSAWFIVNGLENYIGVQITTYKKAKSKES